MHQPAITVPAIVVAVGFGLTVGWGLGFSLPDRRPALFSLLFGLAAGAVSLVASLGSTMAAWSLVLGCGAGLVSFGLKRAA
jgi:hypothetical protein